MCSNVLNPNQGKLLNSATKHPYTLPAKCGQVEQRTWKERFLADISGTQNRDTGATVQALPWGDVLLHTLHLDR